ncbi:MAG: hypothetical protein R3E44_04020 [Paracoccaceae bacterium]
MKRILLTTALVFAAAGTASAMNTATDLSPTDRAEILRYVPNADLSNLTSEQVAILSATLYNGDNNEVGGHIRAILN